LYFRSRLRSAEDASNRGIANFPMSKRTQHVCHRKVSCATTRRDFSESSLNNNNERSRTCDFGILAHTEVNIIERASFDDALVEFVSYMRLISILQGSLSFVLFLAFHINSYCDRPIYRWDMLRAISGCSVSAVNILSLPSSLQSLSASLLFAQEVARHSARHFLIILHPLQDTGCSMHHDHDGG